MKTMKKNLLALGIILMSALTFTACSDDDDFMMVSNQRYQPQTSMFLAPVTLVQMMELLVSLITTYKLVQQHLSFIAMLTRNKMASRLVMHKDLIVFGDKVVVACTTSSKIEVLNRVGKVEQTIKLHNVEPRTWLQMASMFTSLPTAAKYIR